jgi:hypothetical protein
MTTHEEIHDRIQKWDRSSLHEFEKDVLACLEALNDKLAGIEERLKSIEFAAIHATLP